MNPGPAVLVLSIALALATGCGRDAARSPDALPDVLLVSIDTLRADRLSCAGYGRPTTPCIDELAAQGTLFENAIASAGLTAPSHMSLFTGLDPLAHGVRNAGDPARPVQRAAEALPTLPELLRAAGYRTLGFTDRGNLLPEMGFARGFDVQHMQLESLAAKVAAAARALADAPRDQPLFLFFHTYAVHAPYLPPVELHGRFCSAEYRGPFQARHASLAGQQFRAAFGAAHDFLAPFEGLGAADRAWLSDLYDEALLACDARIGELWEAWGRARDPARTLLILTSDHGEEFGEHGGLGHSGDLWPELVRIPMVWRGPGIGPQRRGEVVSLADVLPTLAELVGFSAGDVQGASFAGLLAPGAHRGAERAASSQRLGSPKGGYAFALLQGGLWLHERQSDGARWTRELFDWDADPGASAALGSERSLERDALHAAIERRRLECIQLQERHPATETTLGTDESRAELEALGYVDPGRD